MSNDIIIHCGKTITNNPEFTPENGCTNIADIKTFWNTAVLITVCLNAEPMVLAQTIL